MKLPALPVDYRPDPASHASVTVELEMYERLNKIGMMPFANYELACRSGRNWVKRDKCRSASVYDWQGRKLIDFRWLGDEYSEEIKPGNYL